MNAVKTLLVLSDIAAERERQDEKWGTQNLPMGTDARFAGDASRRQRLCDAAFKDGTGTWRHIFLEEVFEAMAETDPKKLRAELVQVAAVAVAMVEAIDRQTDVIEVTHG